MKRAVIAAAIVFAVAGTTAVYAQHWPAPWRGAFAMSRDDMSAMTDARIAGVKAGLRLTPDQEKLWPPVEAAARDLAKLRVDRMSERREAMRERRSDEARSRSPDELFERFKRRADDMTASATAMKKLTEAADPLYKSLNEDQKRRLVMLVRPPGTHRHMEHRRFWRERTERDGDRDGGPRFHRERGERYEHLPLDRQQL
jgi:hypothetical protein